MDLHEVCITELIYTVVLRTEGSNFGRINEALCSLQELTVSSL